MKAAPTPLLEKLLLKVAKRVILKLSMHEMIGETEFENEIKALELADGNGYVQLLLV